MSTDKKPTKTTPKLISQWIEKVKVTAEGKWNLKLYDLQIEFRIDTSKLYVAIEDGNYHVTRQPLRTLKTSKTLIVEVDDDTLQGLLLGRYNFIDKWQANHIYLMGELPYRSWFSRLIRIGSFPRMYAFQNPPSVEQSATPYIGIDTSVSDFILAGARNLLDRADLKQRENVVVFCNYSLENSVIDAICTAARERQAFVTTVRCKDLLPAGKEEPPRPAREAFKSADVLLDLFPHPLDHTRTAQEAIFDWGVRYVLAPSLSESSLSSEGARWPINVFYTVSRALRDKLRAHKICRITDPKGTDISVEIDPLLVIGECEPMSHPGDIGLFPVGTVIVQPGGSGTGVISYDGYHSWGNTPEPVRATFEKGWCTKIEGGPEAKEVEKYIDGVENSRYFDEVSFGHNPKTRVNRELHQGFDHATLTHAGIVHFGMGESKMDCGRYYSKTHLDGWLLSPTVFLDEELVIENGIFKVLYDEKVREEVREFGDPDVLLATNS